MRPRRRPGTGCSIAASIFPARQGPRLFPEPDPLRVTGRRPRVREDRRPRTRPAAPRPGPGQRAAPAHPNPTRRGSCRVFEPCRDRVILWCRRLACIDRFIPKCAPGAHLFHASSFCNLRFAIFNSYRAARHRHGWVAGSQQRKPKCGSPSNERNTPPHLVKCAADPVMALSGNTGLGILPPVCRVAPVRPEGRSGRGATGTPKRRCAHGLACSQLIGVYF
jgi:hypothetical protein